MAGERREVAAARATKEGVVSAERWLRCHDGTPTQAPLSPDYSLLLSLSLGLSFIPVSSAVSPCLPRRHTTDNYALAPLFLSPCLSSFNQLTSSPFSSAFAPGFSSRLLRYSRILSSRIRALPVSARFFPLSSLSLSFSVPADDASARP